MHRIQMIVCLTSSASLWLYRNTYEQHYNAKMVNIPNFCNTGGLFEDMTEIK